MVYVGSFLAGSPVGGWNSDTAAPCLLNPSLKVASGRPQTDTDMGYWPSYSEITPEHRLTYLTWLSSGKRDPSYPIGYAFLYFYGIERRLLADNPAPQEEALLVKEVERLRAIYSTNSSFSYYSRALLDIVLLRRVSTGALDQDTWIPSLSSISRELPLSLRVLLGMKAHAGVPLTFEQAIAAMLAMPPYQGGVPSTNSTTRCRKEYIELVRIRFARRFPQGFLLRDRKDSRLVLAYRPASQQLEVEVNVVGVDRLPDPCTLTWTKMEKLCSDAASDLAPYARAIGKDRTRAESLAAALFLPSEIADRGALASFKLWLGSLPSPVAEVPLPTLTRWCLGSEMEETSAKQARDLSTMLVRVGYGMEPDPAQGGDKPRASVMLFRADATVPSASFHTATLVSAVFAFVEPGSEETRVVGELALRLKLTLGEAVRLAARHRAMRGRSMVVSKLKLLAGKLSSDERAAVAALAVTVAAACGNVNKQTMAALERLYDTFRIERKTLYAALHQGAASAASHATEPVTVERPTSPDRRFRIPPAPEPAMPKDGLVIDMAKVGAILRETREVADVLTPIYADDDEAPQTMAATTLADGASIGNGLFAGLDPDHTLLLNALRERESWTRADFEATARQFGLMPDGAIEAINEWAYDALGDELIEDGNQMLINVALLTDAPGKVA